MALQRIQFAAMSYQDRSLPVAAQRLVNLYLEPKPPGSKSAQALHGTPGLVAFGAGAGTGPIRGMLGMGDYLYVVSGQELYRVNATGVAVVAGTITGYRPVSMAHNGTQMAIVADTDTFVISDAGLATPGITPCCGVAVQDGYGIFAEQGTERFFISGINDFMAYDATEFALANALPDKLVGIVNVNRETWLFGERSIQVYYDSGNADFPFARIAAGVIQRGCAASRSIVEHDGRVYWLGDDLQVYQSQGYQPVPISTHAIARQIATYAMPEAAVAFAYEQEGHVFYVLSFVERTWVFDASTGLWHERLSAGLNTWRVRTYARWFGKHIVGDGVNGSLYTLDLDTYTDAGVTIRRVATSPPIHAAMLLANMYEVTADIETGVGLTTGQGINPQVMLRWSDDGGVSWSNEHWASLGPLGVRKRRVKWTRLGRFRQRCLELSIADPVKVAILDVFIDAEGGAA